MKKVLILMVIAILALGVMAIADHVGPTCDEATLTVTSNIYVLSGFEATATGYEATFCGASGDLVSGTVLKESSSQWNPTPWPEGFTPSSNPNLPYLYYKRYLILAGLDLKSNYENITVRVTHEGFFEDHSLGNNIDVKAADGWFSSDGTTWHLSADPTTNGSPYSGALYVYYDASDGITQWIEANKYSETIKFTVTPINPNW
ncbi:hypothetical protein [Mesoaciditoga lauensis]|uniref:hypothetical protein n=1 Tax=Mesoaciditoga lauensis TaxID=1495039 RepID=UPI0005656E63|nr:hypothetical protein [Mesoaciditoga lauensis]